MSKGNAMQKRAWRVCQFVCGGKACHDKPKAQEVGRELAQRRVQELPAIAQWERIM